MTVDPAIAVAGDEMFVVTSADGEIALVALALSGWLFGPCETDVPTDELAVTDPEAGVVKVKPIVVEAPDARPDGIPLNVTAPDAALYDAVAAPGNPLNVTPANPGGRPNRYVVPADVDGPVFA